MGVALLRSTSILPIFTLPAYSVASSSTIGAMARHGPHQAAQKSNSTGVSDFRTSWSKFESVTSTIPFPAIVPPTLEILDHAATIVTLSIGCDLAAEVARAGAGREPRGLRADG